MAQNLTIREASPLIGSPITFSVQADTVSGGVSFHRVKLTVKAWLTGDSNETSLTLSSPAESGETLYFDISSALRAVADKYVYTPVPPDNYPVVCYTLSACDEYLLDGVNYDNVGAVATSGTFYALFGAFTDYERMFLHNSGGSKKAWRLTRKPSTLPEVVAVGEQVVRPQDIAPLTAGLAPTVRPSSSVADVTSEGLQPIMGDTATIYAVPQGDKDRYQIRFVNGLGCLESVSVRSLRSVEMNVTQESYIRAVQETFSDFSRAKVTKQNDYETWAMTSGPLDEAWQSWYMHEFLMTTAAWIKIGSQWVPCHIVPEDTVAGVNRQSGDFYEVKFSVRLDISGSPLELLAIGLHESEMASTTN